MINHYYWWIQTYVFLAFATCKYIIIITIYCQHNPSTNVTFLHCLGCKSMRSPSPDSLSILPWCHIHSSSFYSLYSITVGNYCKQETRKISTEEYSAVIISFIIYFSAFEIPNKANIRLFSHEFYVLLLSHKSLLTSFLCWTSQLHSTARTEQPTIIKQKYLTSSAVFLSFDILIILKRWLR